MSDVGDILRAESAAAARAREADERAEYDEQRARDRRIDEIPIPPHPPWLRSYYRHALAGACAAVRRALPGALIDLSTGWPAVGRAWVVESADGWRVRNARGRWTVAARLRDVVALLQTRDNS